MNESVWRHVSGYLEQIKFKPVKYLDINTRFDFGLVRIGNPWRWLMEHANRKISFYPPTEISKKTKIYFNTAQRKGLKCYLLWKLNVIEIRNQTATEDIIRGGFRSDFVASKSTPLRLSTLMICLWDPQGIQDNLCWNRKRVKIPLGRSDG